MKNPLFYSAFFYSFSLFANQECPQNPNPPKAFMYDQLSEEKVLLDTVLQGRLEFFKSSSLFSSLKNASYEDKGTIHYASGIHYAPCNGVFGDLGNAISSQEIENSIQFFSEKNLPFIFWGSDGKLEEKGFQYAGDLLGIALDLSKASYQKISSEIEVKIISSQEDLEIFSHILAEGFGMDPATSKEFAVVLEDAFKQKQQTHFLAFYNGQAVGTATLSTGETAAGVWNLSSLEEFRKKGIGTALVQACLKEAQKNNYKNVMAILMPKGLAARIFKNFGFKDICKLPFYVYGMGSNQLEK